MYFVWGNHRIRRNGSHSRPWLLCRWSRTVVSSLFWRSIRFRKREAAFIPLHKRKKKVQINTMKKDVKVLMDVLNIISKKRKQINFDSNAARHQMAIEVVHELRKRRCQINRIELWTTKRQINTNLFRAKSLLSIKISFHSPLRTFQGVNLKR